MKIRSVTCFVNSDASIGGASLDRARRLAGAARRLFPASGLELETTRIAVQPLDHILSNPDESVGFASRYETTYKSLGFDYGALMLRDANFSTQVPDMLGVTTDLFVSLWIASFAEGLDLAAIRDAARIVHTLAHRATDGLGNFRFAAAANCPPGVPFFPTAYASEPGSSFSFATEAADLAVEAFAGAGTLDAARARLIAAVEREGARLDALGDKLGEASGLHFDGIDFSMAPFPEEDKSLATAIERLTGAPFGTRGTLFAAAFITDALRRAKFPRVGFSGLMLPVLEDWTLARRTIEGLVSLDSLLLYSTVCGTGLDTIPLAGDTSEHAIAALLLDLAALAVRLDKPLTARLIPIPGLDAGRVTEFNFEWFANARAFAIDAPRPLSLLEGDGRVRFEPLHSR